MRKAIALSLLVALPSWASVQIKGATFPETVNSQSATLKLDGAGLLKWRGLVSVYAAALYRENLDAGFPAELSETKRLEIEYFRDISREDLIKGTGIAFERTLPQGESVDDWREPLNTFLQGYAGVQKGDRYALEAGTFGYRLLLNGEVRVEGENAAFGQRLLGIWLAPTSPSEKLREALLAQN